jgi:serine phosphatase RsbU (regulator of sigma subunit)
MELLPEDVGLIRDALAGNSHGTVRTIHPGGIASVAHTIWSQDTKILGAIYIQAPTGTPLHGSLLAELVSVLIPSGLIWLGLMLPVGMVFGVLSIRGLICRIERLARATIRFKEGHPAIRVPIGRPDEIGQLESQFNEMAEQLVESFAQRQVLAEQSARREERARIEQEMRSAHYIQQSLLPEEVADIPGWHIEKFYQPAREVGGDLYDFLALPDGRIGFVIGDATGHGVPSALIMATTSATLHATAASGVTSPGKVLEKVNNLLQKHIPNGTFATCFYATLDPTYGMLRFANAGHNLPYLSRNGKVFELHAKGMPLGLMPEQEYIEGELVITSQDYILFYTDGLVEAHNEQHEMFGSPRLKQRIQENATSECLIETLKKDLQGFTGSRWEQEDDITLVLLRKRSCFYKPGQRFNQTSGEVELRRSGMKLFEEKMA